MMRFERNDWNEDTLREKTEIHTCDLVSMLFTQTPVLQFQKRMCLSAVPPPLASRLGCQGHHARAWFMNDNRVSQEHSKGIRPKCNMSIFIVLLLRNHFRVSSSKFK